MRRKRKRNQHSLAYRTHITKEEQRPSDNESPSSKGNSRWTIDVCGDIESLELATTASQRLRGMLFRDPDEITRLLIPCCDIHTFGMRYPLDVAFISRDGKVLQVHRNVSTMRRIRHKDASLVAERFSRVGEWLKEGDVIRIGISK